MSHSVPLAKVGERVCMEGAGPTAGRGYCGRRSAKTRTTDWAEVQCPDCDAARRADEAVRA